MTWATVLTYLKHWLAVDAVIVWLLILGILISDAARIYRHWRAMR